MIIAEKEDGKRKTFSANVWASIQAWPNQGGWRQVKSQPVEPPVLATAPADQPAEQQPTTQPARHAKKSRK